MLGCTARHPAPLVRIASREIFLLDHEGGNHSAETLEWHRTALGQMRAYLEKGRDITLVGEVEAADIKAWFASMRKTPSSRGKVRSERTIQTYARSARTFFHWLGRRETIERQSVHAASAAHAVWR